MNKINDFNPLQNAWQLLQQDLTGSFLYALASATFICLPALIASIIPSSVIDISPWFHFSYIALSWLLSIIFISSLVFKLNCDWLQTRTKPRAALKQGIIKCLPLALLSIVYGLIVLGGTMLLVVPGVILAISLSFAFAEMIIDNEGILQSLLNSHRFVWERWWLTAFSLSMPILMNLIIMLMMNIGLFTLFYFLHWHQHHLLWLSLLSGIVVQSFFIAYFYACVVVLLHHLKTHQPA